MTLGSVRPPAVAGSFYPGSPRRLEEAVRSYLCAAQAQGEGQAPKALIAPHAGYVYSGPTAGLAYARLASARERIRRVVLIGPAHRVALAGLAVPDADAFATPLGEIPLDAAALQRLLELPQVRVLDAAHAFEHSLEVHLPFLQTVLGSISLVPVLVGDARPEDVAQALEAVWNGPETLIVVSSDLSHYQDYATAQRMDEATASAIESLQPQAIRTDDACGRVPIQGLLLAARHKGLRAQRLDLRNSGDTAGPRDRVVGYGAWAFD